jgi:hypothetical protein
MCYEIFFGFLIMSPNVPNLGYSSTITNTLLPVVKQCILNQNQGFRLLSNSLAYAFTLCNSKKYEVVNIQNLNQPLIQGDFDLELLE